MEEDAEGRFIELVCENKNVFIWTRPKVDEENDADYSRLSIRLHDGWAWFSGVLDFEDPAFRKTAERLDVDVSEVGDMTKMALTTHLCDEYNYDFVEKDDVGRLTWKREVEGTGLSQKIGSVILRKMKSEVDVGDANVELFRYITSSLHRNSENAVSLSEKCESLEAERSKAVKKYEECVESLVERENDLFAKFVPVLNEKKAKIRELMDRLKNDSRGGDYDEDTDVDDDGEKRTRSEEPEDSSPSKIVKTSHSNKPCQSFSVTKMLDDSSDEDDHI